MILQRTLKMHTYLFLFCRNMGNNEITSLEGRPFRGLHELTDLTLGHNYITHIPEDAFYGLDKLLYLYAKSNRVLTSCL